MTATRWWCRQSAIAALLIAANGLPGCTLFGDAAPRQATLLLDGPAGSQAFLTVSQQFLAASDAQGTTRVTLLAADTATVTLPYERTFNMRSSQRLFAEARGTGAPVSGFRMRVFLDDRGVFSERGALNEAAPYRFVYAFNEQFGLIREVTF
jgi:hypothetical protein